ncbi:ABC transporter permease [Wenzhouxiangella sp. AB-CW3]|uniref:ABC transporter permease n=1 Tax=Wenzhouxiangella sp. AB-CW3 TaxID=2771012 RepID=UPI00168A88C7|nr:ABC transporter permease [Wenzhouxiangella sp. AB-CW3]QOC22187.1 ABC transporter permease [Wenzhouxiangella sp. AB-CW3]
MGTILEDLRYAIRQLTRNPAFTVAAILTLALGIGAVAAIFAVLRGVVLDPLPFPEHDRLVRLTSPVPGVAEDAVWHLSNAQYFHFRKQAEAFERVGVWQITGQTVRVGDESQRALTAIVSSDMMSLLGGRPALGRTFASHDHAPDASAVVVLTHEFWQREFGADPGVIGRMLEFEGERHEIIGVMSPGVRLPGDADLSDRAEQPELWVALRLDPAGPYFNSHVFLGVARLAEGVHHDQAQDEVSRMTARLHEEFPDAYFEGFIEQFGFRTRVTPLKDFELGPLARHLWLLFGAIGLVLLIALANVANLFLVRMEGRHRELAVRAALGASRRVIARHVLIEAMVFAVLGGLLAVLGASMAVRLLIAKAPETLPRLDNIGVDADVGLLVVAVSLLAGVVLTALVLVRYRHDPAVDVLGGETRSTTAGIERQHMRAGLVGGQVALALVLLVAAGLLVQSYQKLSSIDPGFEPESVIRMQLHLPFAQYNSHEAVWQFHGELIERVEALPGVVSASVGNPLPLSGEYACSAQDFEGATGVDLESKGEDAACGDIVFTAPGYFETLGIPLLSGRTFTHSDLDHPDTGAVVVSQTFAERFWPDQNPLGKGVRPLMMPGDPPEYYRVVGVVGDVPEASLEGSRPAAIYYPITPKPGERLPLNPSLHLHLIVKTGNAVHADTIARIRDILEALDVAVPISLVGTLKEDLADSKSQVSFIMTLLAIAAMAALLLAAVGLYGVIAYLIARRTNEIGIRMALGATPHQVVRIVVAGSMKMVALGVGVGLVAAVLLTRLMHGMLYGITPGDPGTYLLAAGLLVVIGLTAAYVPARRASRLNPVAALRIE